MFIQKNHQRYGNLGEYNIKENKITIYRTSDFSTANKQTFIHELLHVLQNYIVGLTSELSNEFWTRELIETLLEKGILDIKDINGKFDIDTKTYNYSYNGYDYYMPIYYVIAELVDKNVLREFQFYSRINYNLGILVDGIAKYEDQTLDESYAINIIETIESKRTINENNHYQYNYSGITESYDDLNYYYKIKKGCDIKDDLGVSIYYNHNILYEEIGKMNWLYSKDEQIAMQKAILKSMPEEVIVDFLGEEVEDKDIDEKMEEKLSDDIMTSKYVIPKTYYSDSSKNPVMVFETWSYEKTAWNSSMKIEITDDVISAFEKEWSAYKEKAKINEMQADESQIDEETER